MIAIVDYGMGNLRSVLAGFTRVGHDAVITREPAVIDSASHVVLPGVGAFRDCMDNLEKYRLVESILKAIDSGKPFLGICLGLQLLFEESEEFGKHKGLGVLKGRVVRFKDNMPEKDGNEDSTQFLKIPHMGWNNIRILKRHDILNGLSDNSYLYFVHSYYVEPEDKDAAVTITSYGMDFVSSVSHKNIFACQFHPEKSQKTGLKILKNFGNI